VLLHRAVSYAGVSEEILSPSSELKCAKLVPDLLPPVDLSDPPNLAASYITVQIPRLTQCSTVKTASVL
jgi:hypothetical protein